MKLILETVIPNFDGTFDVGVVLEDKKTRRYSFEIPSEFVVRRVQLLCSKKAYGKAINLLKERNINGATSLQ